MAKILGGVSTFGAEVSQRSVDKNLATNHLQTLTDVQTSIYYALQCAATTTQIKLLTLAHCGLYTSYTTSYIMHYSVLHQRHK